MGGVTKAVIDRAGKGSALTADEYDTNVDSMCGVCEADTSGSYTVVAADQNKTIQVSHATAVAVLLTAPATTIALLDTTSFKVTIKNIGAGDAAIDPGAQTIDGSTTDMVLKQWQFATLQTDTAGTGWNVIATNAPRKSVDVWAVGADVASPAGGALPVLPDGNYFDVTGTNTITSIDAIGVGTVIKLHFDGALDIVDDADNIILPSGGTLTTVAGDEAEFVEHAAGKWRCTDYSPVGGGPSISRLSTAAEGDLYYLNSTGVFTRLALGTAGQALVVNSAPDAPEWGNGLTGTGAAPYYGCRAFGVLNGTGTPAWASRANFDAAVTDNGTGNYSITFTTDMTDTEYSIQLSVPYSGSATQNYVSYSNKATTGFDIRAYQGISGYSANDLDGIQVAVFR